VIISLAAATIRGPPCRLVLAALAGLYAERSGIVEIGLRRQDAAAAFFAPAPRPHRLGLLGPRRRIAGRWCWRWSRVASVRYNGNQVVSGMRSTSWSPALTPPRNAWFHQGGQTPGLSGGARFADIAFPFATTIGAITVIGPL